MLLYFDIIDSMHVGHPSVSVDYLFLHVPHMHIASKKASIGMYIVDVIR